MDLENNYGEYVLQFSLAMVGAAAAYIFQPSSPLSFASLLFIPVLFGYTAYISREGFRTSSLTSLVALVFLSLGGIHAVISAVIAVGNVLVSFFANGESFKDYYGATSIPLILIGLFIGVSVYGLSTANPGMQQNIENSTANTAGNLVGASLNQTGIIEMQKETNQQFMEQSSTASVQATQVIVAESLENSSVSLSQQEKMALQNSFEKAAEEVPTKISQQSPDVPKPIQISERVEDSVRNLMQPQFMIAVIPLSVIFFFTLQPLLGLLTAISGKVAELLAR